MKKIAIDTPPRQQRKIKKCIAALRLSCILLFVGILPVHGHAQDEKITIDRGVMTLEQLFDVVARQLHYSFFYSDDELDARREVTLPVSATRLDDLLRIALEQRAGFRFVGKTIVITPLPQSRVTRQDTVSGVVLHNGLPLSGVNVVLKDSRVAGTATDAAGRFRLLLPPARRHALLFSYIGMETREIAAIGGDELTVTLEEAIGEIGEVVIMGMFNRRAESFTGATVTFRREELKRVGEQNLLVSLRNLDPSFIIQENLEFGSDPNHLPEITMRGQTTIPVDVEGEYRGSLNQPLFILDGFETTLQTVFDLDVNKVAGVTLLKDAAAKAIYGSKAANGVVVIETILPRSGNLQLAYNGSVNAEAPDLTSYNLANSAEKLQAEWLSGKYTKSGGNAQAAALADYYALQKEVARGVDTYWLSQPLRVGVGQKHALNFTGGTRDMRYSINVSLGNTKGVMIGSNRQTLSGNIMLSYHAASVSIRNNLSASVNNGKNSPYGSFSSYANMNPYWRVKDERGNLIKQYDSFHFNPLYNAAIGIKDESSYTTITENLYIEWTPAESLRFTGKLGVSKAANDAERFLPADHTSFANVSPFSEAYADRGSYDVTYGKSLDMNAELGLAYSIRAGKHALYSNAVWKINTSESQSISTSVVGFASDKMNFISLGNRYNGEKPAGSESLARAVDLVASANYSYDNRYFSDLSYTGSASSRFGANKRWGHFWSAGVGWNIHNEPFARALGFANNLRLRGSIGYTGSQEFDPYQAIASYTYYTGKSYDGALGNYLLAVANNDLKWQQQFDRNLGLDLTLFDRFSARLEVYSNVTKDLLTDVTLAPSIGFAAYKENLGEKVNRGYELHVQWKAYSSPARRASVNIFAGMAHNSDKLLKISDALRRINETQDAKYSTKPLVRFEEGKSTTGIWVVPSKGVDPVTGNDVFIARDGSLTDVWSAEHYRVMGNTQASITGNIGAYLAWRGLSANLSFSYRLGGQTYNSTLVDKVENVDIANNNVDRRVLYDRWNAPGVAAKYKSIADYTSTYPTSRFVEDLDEFIFSAVNISYELGELRVFRSLDRLRASFNMNDVGRFTTVKQERGTAYPFARAFSLSLSATF
ncbi:MAG: SusC/RagA family TonB-linked outer membrane protein [Odoribacteraceae bacterium]|jgi:TonB-linked SusC/RagA family outer membrane protein|nr:SusC/RagA family TonB-linked outer membrane protein [Odoribacteraceae bacterium]